MWLISNTGQGFCEKIISSAHTIWDHFSRPLKKCFGMIGCKVEQTHCYIA